MLLNRYFPRPSLTVYFMTEESVALRISTEALANGFCPSSRIVPESCCAPAVNARRDKSMIGRAVEINLRIELALWIVKLAMRRKGFRCF
jgi:hypothetical protein